MNDLKIIRPKELADLLSVSAATLWRMEKSGKLPPKVTLSKRAVGWKETDIKKWIDNNQESKPVAGISDE